MASYVAAPGTWVPPGPRSSRATLPAWTGSLRVAVTSVPTGTLVAPVAGVRPVTVGLVVSVPLEPSAKTTSTQ